MAKIGGWSTRTAMWFAAFVLVGAALFAVLFGSRTPRGPVPFAGWERFTEGQDAAADEAKASAAVARAVEAAAGAAKATLVYYSLNGCPHCEDFNPVWELIEKDEGLGRAGVAAVKYTTPDDKENHATADGVDRYPTLILKKGDGEKHVFKGSRSQDAIVRWALETAAA